MRRIAVTVLVLALLVATTAAFAVTEVLKLQRSPVTRPRFDKAFSPTCGCRQDTARLSIRLRRADSIDAVIVDENGDPVRTLASGANRVPGRIAFRWNGRDDEGRLLPDGPYRLRLHLADERRTIVVPNQVRVDTEAPRVELVSLSPRRISPDGDAIRDRTAIAFRASEPARPIVLVDGAVAFEGKLSAAGNATLAWGGTADGRPLPAGGYLIGLEARDRAGNVSTPTSAIALRIRYIELVPATLRVRRGGLLRFRVATDAQQYAWKLFPPGSPRRPVAQGGPVEPGAVAVRLDPTVRPGRYVLRASANGHHDDTVVVVLARR